MSDEKLLNIARLMTTFNFEIEQLPDDLKCAQCKLVLEDAYQLPCGCKVCRTCIDKVIERGSEFCPGDSDYSSNRSIFKLAVKCPHDGCVHDCQLVNIEKHLRECPRKMNEECSFRELAAEEKGGRLQHENHRHSEILIEMIANINRKVETLKHELVLKDEQIRSIMDQMTYVQKENESIKNEIKSIKEEKEVIAGQVRILTQKIDERRENDELDSSRVIVYVDREIAALSILVESNKDELVAEMQTVRGDIGLINQDFKSIKGDICSVKSQVQSIQGPVRLGQVDARFEWLINKDFHRTSWGVTGRLSEYFFGAVHPYKYRLRSGNYDISTRAQLRIELRIYSGLNDGQLSWPFEARVVITVIDRDRRDACRRISRLCRMERPLNESYRESDTFVFHHSELMKAGLDLSRGLRVSCVIIPGAE